MKKTRVSQISTQHSTVKQEETISYRGTVATVELVALGSLIMALQTLDKIPEDATKTMAWSGLFTHGFGGSLVHLYHGNYGKALASAGLRVGIPIAGVARCFLSSCYDWAPIMIGFAAGFVLAPIIDIVFLASKTKSTTQDETLIEYGSLKATPSFGVTPKGDLTFGLAGHF